MTSRIQVGTKLGRYEIRSHIGAGGMGDVYLARDTELDRTVALKVLPASVATDEQRMRRFVQEAKAASSLNHQNIITIYEIGNSDSSRFIATEFVDGVTLRQKLRRGRLNFSETLDIGIQIASGLAAAHEAGIIHRDVKPENVMLRNRDGFVKLLDFGLVKLTEVSRSDTDTEAPTRALVNTDAGTVMGTVVYMSPEQARGKSVDERTDIWSLGVILYEMVTGVAPFAGETSADVIAAIVKTDPPPITRLVPEAPPKLEEIISKALLFSKCRDIFLLELLWSVFHWIGYWIRRKIIFHSYKRLLRIMMLGRKCIATHARVETVWLLCGIQDQVTLRGKCQAGESRGKAWLGSLGRNYRQKIVVIVVPDSGVPPFWERQSC